MRLYHFTNRRQLPHILSSGELLMTPNPYTPRELGPIPVLWLSTQSGDDHVRDSIAHGLGMAGPVQGFAIDRIDIRFTVDVPDEEVVSWDDYCDYYGVEARIRRQLAKWPSHSEWWVPFLRNIKSDEWVDISVGSGNWKPMLAPNDTESPAEEVIEP